MPVSGPGPYSQRTDKQPIRNPGGLPYGDNQALKAMEQAAPMQAAPQLPPTPIVPIHAPTQQPAQPVTSGADRGPGPDSSVLTQRPGAVQGTPLVQALSAAAANDPSGQLAMLLTEAMKRGL